MEKNTQIIELREFEFERKSEEELSRPTARKIALEYSKYVSIESDIREEPLQYKLYPGGYVGYIPVSNNLVLKINPKVGIRNIFLMMEYAYDLDPKFFKGEVTLDTIEAFYENLASILARRVLERHRKGLYKDYVTREEPLQYLKGRLDTGRTLSSIYGGAVRFHCAHDENTVDVVDNQILAWTLYSITRLRLEREEVKRDIRHAFRAISNNVDLRQVDAQECVGRFYHRLNEDYEPMHGLCRFFLENCGPVNNSGDREFLPFVVNMAALFEKFVARWLSAELAKEGIFELKEQHKVDLNPDKTLSFRIDLVLRNKSSKQILAVLDTKYKNHRTPSEGDVQQVIAYATGMKTDLAILIYPSIKSEKSSFTCGNIRGHSLIFDISQEPADAGKTFMKELFESLSR